MAAITAAMVGELRAKTDAPMMECKKALTEAGGDMDKAEELLRVKLGGKAAKASARITAEGVVASHIAGNIGALVEVNSETDFVAKNDDFLALAALAAKLAAENNPADVAALLALPAGNGQTLEEVRAALVGKIGENMSIRRFQRFETTGKLAAYLHGTKIGVIVEFDGADEQVGKDVAMHIAAMKPVALSSEQVPADLIARALGCPGQVGRRRCSRCCRWQASPARRHRCQAYRWRRCQVPERSVADEPGFREERQAVR